MTTQEDNEASLVQVNVKVFSLQGVEVDGYDTTNRAGDDDDDIRTTQQEEDDPDVEEALPPSSPKFRKQLLCCPLTRQPFHDPVVCRKDGVSYEREALIAAEGDRGYYSNRALLDYMDPRTNPNKELQHCCMDKKGIFYCSITSDLVRDPVIDPEGNTFERAAIVDWIQEHGVSPITRNPLQVDQLYDNTTLFRVLYREVLHSAEDIRNSDEIRAWKRDVSNFNYLTNTVKPTTITTTTDNDKVSGSSRTGLQLEQARRRHPADMRVDYNGRWRHRNKDTVTIIGLLLVCLCVIVFLFLEFPIIAIWCLGGLLAVALVFGLVRLCRSRSSEL